MLGSAYSLIVDQRSGSQGHRGDVRVDDAVECNMVRGYGNEISGVAGQRSIRDNRQKRLKGRSK